jgi:hypothetical protein
MEGALACRLPAPLRPVLGADASSSPYRGAPSCRTDEGRAKISPYSGLLSVELTRTRRSAALCSKRLQIVGNGIWKRDESGGPLLSLPNRAVQFTVKLGQLVVSGRELRIFDSFARFPKYDEYSLYHQWFPTVKRRGIVFFISAAVIAMLAVSGPANYALQPASNIFYSKRYLHL